MRSVECGALICGKGRQAWTGGTESGSDIRRAHLRRMSAERAL